MVDRSHRRVFRDADPSQEPQTLVGGRTIDLQYRQRRQITDLLAASDILGVPAAYALYCGPISYRQDLPCGPTHKPTDDDRCHRSGVCVLPALSAMDFLELAEFANDPARMAIDAYEWATPLEDLVDPRRGPHRVHDPRLSIANADLRSFLLQPQPLPMSIAKKIFHTVSRLRQVKASAAPPIPREFRIDQPLFADDPFDPARARVPYLNHVLRGLRRQPPTFLTAIADGAAPPSWLSDLAAGVVIADVY